MAQSSIAPPWYFPNVPIPAATDELNGLPAAAVHLAVIIDDGSIPCSTDDTSIASSIFSSFLVGNSPLSVRKIVWVKFNFFVNSSKS